MASYNNLQNVCYWDGKNIIAEFAAIVEMGKLEGGMGNSRASTLLCNVVN